MFIQTFYRDPPNKGLAFPPLFAPSRTKRRPYPLFDRLLFPSSYFFFPPFIRTPSHRPLHTGPLRTSRPGPGDIPILSAAYRFCGILRVRYVNFRRIQLLFQNVELDYRFCRRKIKRHGAPEIIGTGANERVMGKSCLFVPIFYECYSILYEQWLYISEMKRDRSQLFNLNFLFDIIK